LEDEMSRIMAHMVPYYPDPERSAAVAEGLVEGGAAYLEVQFPFSDPTADGPAIQAACQAALNAGFTIDRGFRFVEEIAGKTGVPVFIMSYASPVYVRGVREFMASSRDAGATGLILPDIPFDHDEGTFAAASEHGLSVMPVVVTSMNPARLAALRARRPEYIYVALRRGITGTRTTLGEENIGFLDELTTAGARIMAGFGISDREQVRLLEPHVHAAIVGSALVRTVERNQTDPPEALRAALAAQVAGLVSD
jgi:tryptophan synthase alpha chain